MNIKRIIIILVVVLLILSILLGILILYKKDQENGNYSYVNLTEDLSVALDGELTEVTDRNNFYIVESCINRYYLFLTKSSSNNITANSSSIESQENIEKQAIYEMLDKTYIDSENLTVDNIFDNIQQIDESKIIIDKMYVSQIDRNMSVYLVAGKEITIATSEEKDSKMIVKMDMANKTFSLIVGETAERIFNESKKGEKLNITTETTIEKTDYNGYVYNNISDDEYVTDMFDQFKTYLISYREEAYERLNEEYKSKKFENFEEFNQYVKDNIKDIVIAKADKSKTSEYDGHTQYVIMDQYGNYYIFNETAAMGYTVILDTYTVDLPEFTEQYNSANDGERAGLNLQRAFDAINNKDYEYVYNKLDDTFKENNFPTLNEFEEYITENFYNSNNVTYSNYKSSGGLHMYDATIVDAENEKSSPITKTFIIKLLDGTDFTMSFNV